MFIFCKQIVFFHIGCFHNLLSFLNSVVSQWRPVDVWIVVSMLEAKTMQPFQDFREFSMFVFISLMLCSPLIRTITD